MKKVNWFKRLFCKDVLKENMHLKKENDSMIRELYETGAFFVKSPFVPQDFMFKETVHEEAGVIIARIYSRDGFDIARYVDTSKREWVVSDPKGKKTEVLFPNTRDAVIILKALGMNIRFEDQRITK